MGRKQLWTIIVVFIYAIVQILIYNSADRAYEGTTLLVPRPKPFLDNYSIELTIRVSIRRQRLVKFLMCDLFRSAVVLWNKNYGDVVLILDEEDKDTLPQILNSSLPFNLRVYYEKPPPNARLVKRIAQHFRRPFGYYRMIYSTFYLDLYTPSSADSIIALTDTDVIFTLPVIKPMIYRNGKIVVKGVNSFRFSWVQEWAETTVIALGGRLPMIADFMSYFPQYIFRSTITKCREYILKTLQVKTVEDAMAKIARGEVCPINIILNYAYYFERDRYEWHIDLVTESLQAYNSKHSIKSHELKENDIKPELHQTVHKPYYKIEVEPFKQALCYAFFATGKYINECNTFKRKVNWQLFHFQSQLPQTLGWCGGAKQIACIELINHTYDIFSEQYKKGLIGLETKYIRVVEEAALNSSYKFQCSPINIKFP